MRVALVGMVAVAVLVAAVAGMRPPAASACPTSAGLADASKRTKPSSFAPRPRPPHNAYGQPIGGKILTKRLKKKPESGNLPAT